MITPACAGEESGEDVDEDNVLDAFIDDEGDEAVDVEAAQLLQGLRSQDRLSPYCDAGAPRRQRALQQQRWLLVLLRCRYRGAGATAG